MLDWQSRLLEDYRKQLENLGLDVIPSTDIVAMDKVVRTMGRGKAFRLTPHFSPKENTFSSDEAFWVGVWKNRQCVGLVASKLQKTGEEPLSSYIQRYWKRVYRSGSKRPFKFRKWQKEILSSYHGDMIYSGEFRVHPDYRGQHFAEPLAMFLRVYSFLLWEDADLFYIFMEDENARRRSLASRVQLTIQIPDALNWHIVPSQAKSDYWFCAMERSHYRDFVFQWAQTQLRPKSTMLQFALSQQQI